MITSVLIDLLIAAVIALSVYRGWKKGMVRSLLALAGTILSIIAATQIANFASELIVNEVIRPATESAIEEHLQELDQDITIVSPVKDLKKLIDSIENELVREKANELLNSMEMSDEPIVITSKDDLKQTGEAIVNTVLSGAVQEIISAIISLICFALLSFALQPVIWIIDQAFHLPLLRQVNQIGGLASGAVKGIFLVLIAVWALRAVYITDEIVEYSCLLKIAVDCLNSLGFGSAVIL